MQTQDYYKILALDKRATPSEIKKAYKTLAIKYHPDRNPDDMHASEKMAALNEAYAVLSNPDKKREYDMLRDRFGEDAAGRFRQNNTYDDILRNSDIEKIFQEIAQSFGIRGLNDLFSNVNISGRSTDMGGSSFFFFGTFGTQPHNGLRRETFGQQQSSDYVSGGQAPWGDLDNRSETAPKLKFHQKVLRDVGSKIMKKAVDKLLNAGVNTLNELHAANRGDIHDTITLSASHAKRGGPYAYYHQHKDKKLIVKIPENIQNGHKIRLKGAGFPSADTGENGDLFLMVNVKQNLLSKVKNFISK
ncbi:MAG: DnaJ domain-containing protein [Desulfamplus sp.]|nr:DnaJ domain-containing protein [Desulfamplus sp.]